MKLSFSNIAWTKEYDEGMYSFLREQGFDGIEIAPTRVFAENPYDHLTQARRFSVELCEKYDLSISSMQSILYGRTESIFGRDFERVTLINYLKKAIDFAEAISCKNLVFGCPVNRAKPHNAIINLAYEFFSDISAYASAHNTTVAIEPNPAIYNTNFINYTWEAFEFAKSIEHLKVNIDLGTVIENNEKLNDIANNMELVNHIHISEPNLVIIKNRTLHNELCSVLTNGMYEGYVSVEMKNPGNIDAVKETAKYIKACFTNCEL
jgi:sugar phosphate isomerase/epimerase